jgi:hypothetical protein
MLWFRTPRNNTQQLQTSVRVCVLRECVRAWMLLVLKYFVRFAENLICWNGNLKPYFVPTYLHQTGVRVLLARSYICIPFHKHGVLCLDSDVRTKILLIDTRHLTLILLMWRTGWAPKGIQIYIQQDATLHSLFISGNVSTCFGWYFHPSSGAHTTVSTVSGICHTVTSICRYRGRVGTG